MKGKSLDRQPWYVQVVVVFGLLVVFACAALVWISSSEQQSRAQYEYVERQRESDEQEKLDSEFEKEVENREVVVKDEPVVCDPPHYVQMDERWKDLPYSKGTVETYGCGLTAAASYVSYVLQDPNYTVQSLYSEVGDSCLTGDVNDMRKFCQYISATYGVSCSDQYWDVSRAKADLQSGMCLFASVSGSIEEGYRNYGGHVVLIYKWDDQGIWISDPGDPSFEVPISEERFDTVFQGQYFYSLCYNFT